jgi:hypothetical protein
MRSYLQTQVASRRRRLAALDHERAALLGEIAAYEDALARSTDGSEDPSSLSGPTEPQEFLPVSRSWFVILQRLAEFTHFNANDVVLIARALHQEGKLRKPQTNDGVRAQLSLYAKKVIVKRRGGGNYQVTEKTKELLEIGVGKLVQSERAAVSFRPVWARATDSGPKHGG